MQANKHILQALPASMSRLGLNTQLLAVCCCLKLVDNTKTFFTYQETKVAFFFKFQLKKRDTELCEKLSELVN